MPTYLAERYVPRATGSQISEIAGAAAAVCAQAAAASQAIRCLAVMLVPGDELCYCLFEAPALEAVRQAHEFAQISCERIVEAFLASPPITSADGAQ